MTRNPPRISWTRIAITAAASFAIGSIPTVFNGQWGQLGTSVVILTVIASIAAMFFHLGRASAKAEQIYREELDSDPDPFAAQLHVEYRDTQTYDLTIGLLTPGDPKATEDSQSILRHLTRDDLITVIAQHGGHRWQALTPTGRLTLRGGAQLTWQPSTTDTTGDDR